MLINSANGINFTYFRLPSLFFDFGTAYRGRLRHIITQKLQKDNVNLMDAHLGNKANRKKY